MVAVPLAVVSASLASMTTRCDSGAAVHVAPTVASTAPVSALTSNAPSPVMPFAPGPCTVFAFGTRLLTSLLRMVASLPPEARAPCCRTMDSPVMVNAQGSVSSVTVLPSVGIQSLNDGV